MDYGNVFQLFLKFVNLPPRNRYLLISASQKSLFQKFKSFAILICTSISLQEPIDESRCNLNCLSNLRFAQPSAIFAGTDFDAFLSCRPRSFLSNMGSLLTFLLTIIANSYAS